MCLKLNPVITATNKGTLVHQSVLVELFYHKIHRITLSTRALQPSWVYWKDTVSHSGTSRNTIAAIYPKTVNSTASTVYDVVGASPQ